VPLPEFSDQIENYIVAGFDRAAGMSAEAFRQRLEPYRDAFERAAGGEWSPLLVLGREFATAGQLVAAIDRTDGKPGTVIDASELEAYSVRDGISIPEGDAYVVEGISKEPATRNVSPSRAIEGFSEQGQTPLTIEEGLALWQQAPGAIDVNDGLSLAASTRGDRRVPAIWISKKQPKLGWCFFGVPHTWLATASCLGRIGVN
jgi:hypothetical protein